MNKDLKFRIEALQAFNNECLGNKSGLPTSKWIKSNPKYMEVVREVMLEKMKQNNDVGGVDGILF